MFFPAIIAIASILLTIIDLPIDNPCCIIDARLKNLMNYLKH